MRLDVAQLYVIGRADVWLRSFVVLLNPPPWAQLCKLICNRFANCSIYDVMDDFHSLSRTMSKFPHTLINLKKSWQWLRRNTFTWKNNTMWSVLSMGSRMRSNVI